MNLFLSTAIATTALALSYSADAQEGRPNGMPSIPPEIMEQMRKDQEAYRAMPDTPGTGPFAAIKEEIAGLPDHTVYRPADLSKVAKGSLPILAWGNGGCSGDGAGARLHLLEIASHGFLAIANGSIKSGPGVPEELRAPPPPMRREGEPFTPPPPQSSAAQLTEAIDWAIAENGRAGSPFEGKINVDAVAVSGWSCGGVQALTIATSDARVDTALIHNSGLLPEGGFRLPGMELTKESLGKLSAPVIYIIGGPTDIAYKNGMDDFKRIDAVPVAMANLDVGHGGTFVQPNGGEAARVAVAWLAWKLKGDETAATWFTGPDCKLCSSATWSYEYKEPASGR